MSAWLEIIHLDCCCTKPQKTKTAPVVSEKNYLNRIVEIDPQKSGESHARSARCWQIASWVTVVAFLALTAVAAVFTSLYYPAYITLTAIAAIGLVDPAIKLFSHCYANAEHHQKTAKEELGTAKILENIKAQGIDQGLSKLGIQKHQIKNHSQLKDLEPIARLAARYEFWKNHSEELNNEMTLLLKEKPEDAETLKSNRGEALKLKQAAHIAKVQAAYYYGLALTPFQQADFDSIYTIQDSSLADRYLEHYFDKSEKFLIFKDSTKTPIRREEMDNISIPDLANKIMTAAPAV